MIRSLEFLKLQQDFCFAGRSPDQGQLVVYTGYAPSDPQGQSLEDPDAYISAERHHVLREIMKKIGPLQGYIHRTPFLLYLVGNLQRLLPQHLFNLIVYGAIIVDPDGTSDAV